MWMRHAPLWYTRAVTHCRGRPGGYLGPPIRHACQAVTRWWWSISPGCSKSKHEIIKDTFASKTHYMLSLGRYMLMAKWQLDQTEGGNVVNYEEKFNKSLISHSLNYFFSEALESISHSPSVQRHEWFAWIAAALSLEHRIRTMSPKWI